MRSLIIVFLFALLAVGQTRNIRDQLTRLLHEYRRDNSDSVEPSFFGDNDDQATLFYDFPERDPNRSFMKELQIEGENGFVYMGSVSNASYAGMPIYAKLNGRATEYNYHFLRQPTTGAQLLEQLQSEGEQGYRIKTRTYMDGVVYIAYIKEVSRRSTQFTYRYLPPPNELDVFFQQANEQGADGYRYWGYYNMAGYSSIYIKDLSQYQSSYEYKQTLPINSSIDFITKTNELGQQGYRFVTFQAIISQTKKSSNGIPMWWSFPLYYKDTSQSAIYEYRIQPNVKTFPDYLAQFHQQAQDGYLFLSTMKYSPADSFVIYYNWGQGADFSLNIDGGY